MNNIEVRNNDINFIKDEDENRQLKGYAILFNSLSEPLYNNSFREIILPNAFSASLEKNDQVCLWGHDTMYVLGRKSSGTLLLREDDKGLYFEVEPPKANWANDLIESVHRGDIKQMSFGFNVTKDRWIDNKNDIPTREIISMELYEISLVTFPAYSNTSVRDNSYIPKPILNTETNYSHIKRKLNIYKLKNK